MQEISFKDIMSKQMKEENISRGVVKVLKEKEGLVRNKLEKRNAWWVLG